MGTHAPSPNLFQAQMCGSGVWQNPATKAQKRALALMTAAIGSFDIQLQGLPRNTIRHGELSEDGYK
ncbi:hypothetical protein F441_17520 [Phytophthora nicotianae CJ01A1]|uniref:Uncharacterized protein n=5 Tax=Phytophthora nicotianae TaxID=4792 RepID=V9EAQ9_PHYNI|nr:hypothetical protein F443_17653 [Phytophthora nicotianae P1569]ETL29831.1 hypothetical protein L916_17081 [Phytophthora nicotianae]ETO64889.1 hypothetical protein F444_17692 [Phytophthora nicotianae P1976]ETP05989.1 hypothetical protein F441_17520 [Phytophthora nicotianae CJ01A1]ETP34099.1 hypothetical protein F442_17505 [Phytophthora nicotianae P10297]